MDTPEIVQTALGDEAVAARVTLGGEDELLVTPTRTLVYRAEGLLSDESVDEYPHGAERVVVSEGRRKSKVTLDYGLDGERTFTVPTKRLDDALHPVLAGVLNAAGITDTGETVSQTYRFSELTLVVTSDRLVKHIGTAVWDEEFEEFHYDEVTDLTFEDGSVATAVVLTLGGRQERFKAPNDKARAIREGLTNAVLSYHDVDSLESLRSKFGDDEPEEPSAELSFGEGPTPLSANPSELSDDPANATRADDTGDDTAVAGRSEVSPAEDVPADSAAAPTDSPKGERRADAPVDTTTDVGAAADTPSGPAEEPTARSPNTDGFGDSGFEPASQSSGSNEEGTESPVDTIGSTAEATGTDGLASLESEIAALRETVESQNERLDRQEALISQLIEELRQGR